MVLDLMVKVQEQEDSEEVVQGLTQDVDLKMVEEWVEEWVEVQEDVQEEEGKYYIVLALKG